MKWVSIVIYVFFMGALGLTAHGTTPASILYDDLNSLYGWDSPELRSLDCRNTQQAGVNSKLDIAGDYLFDDCLFILKEESGSTALEAGNKKWADYFDNQGNRLAYTGYDINYAGSEFSFVSNLENLELANNPSPRIGEYDKLIYWIKDAYRAWVPKDHSGTTRLLLLSFGLVGIIGMRRKFKKS